MVQLVNLYINKASQEVWAAWSSKQQNVSQSVISLIKKDLQEGDA